MNIEEIAREIYNDYSENGKIYHFGLEACIIKHLTAVACLKWVEVKSLEDLPEHFSPHAKDYGKEYVCEILEGKKGAEKMNRIAMHATMVLGIPFRYLDDNTNQ